MNIINAILMFPLVYICAGLLALVITEADIKYRDDE